MTDQTFEARLSRVLTDYAEDAIRPIDAMALATTSIAARPRAAWRDRLLRLPVLQRLGAPVIVAILLLVTLLAVIVAGSRLLDRMLDRRLPLTDRPLIEETAPDALGIHSVAGAALLADGRVLIVGGFGQEEQGTLATAELFDPVTLQFTQTGSMATPRAEPLVIGLRDGRALVVGGYEADPATDQPRWSSAEIFDAAAGTFSPAGDLAAPRLHCPCGALNGVWSYPSLTVLRDGRVFITGGSKGGSGPPGTYADIFDPSSGEFSQVDVGCDASRSAQVGLRDGRVLVTCLVGRNGTGTNQARLFDPSTNMFSDAPGLATANNGNATLLPDGRVLLTGSILDPGSELYDPSTGRFELLRTQIRPNGGQTGFDIGGGRVLFLSYEAAAPDPQEPSLIFDVDTMTFSTVAAPGFYKTETAVRLSDGRILTIGYAKTGRVLNPTRLP